LSNIVIQKFGGTSVRDIENRKECFKKIAIELNNNKKVIVVVSAMGRKGEPYATDTLISLTNEIEGKEKDLLMATGEMISASIFVNDLKKFFEVEHIKDKTVSILTGGEAGIITDSKFNKANIIAFETENLEEAILNNNVVIVTGFQGKTKKGEITTLGRGGSDTSAVALGVAIKAEKIEIFSDVNGMMSADPKMVVDAKMIRHINYEDALNLSYYGAKVIDPRALEIGKKYNAKIILKSTFTDDRGTIISSDIIGEREIEGNAGVFSGIAYKNEFIQYEIFVDKIILKSIILTSIKEIGISLDMINIEKERMSFITEEENEKKIDKILSDNKLKGNFTKGLSKLTIVGEKIAGVPGIMQSIIEPIFNEGIEVIQTSDSHTTICLLVEKEELKKALCILHKKFFQ
jgi:aspartate kinase